MPWLTGCIAVKSPNALDRNRDPEKALKAYVSLGLAYLKKGNMEGASRTLKRAWEIDSDDAQVNHAYALFYTVENEPSQVIKHYEAALQADPELSAARNNYAAFLYREGDFQQALQQLQIVSKDYRYQKRYQSFENMGLCYLKLGQTDKAEEAFQRALQLNFNLPRALLEMADLSFQKQDLRTADFYLQQLDRQAVQPSARQLWLEMLVSKAKGDKNRFASLALALKNRFPLSPEYQRYQKHQRYQKSHAK